MRLEEEVARLAGRHREQPGDQPGDRGLNGQHHVGDQKAQGADEMQGLVDAIVVIEPVVVPSLGGKCFLECHRVASFRRRPRRTHARRHTTTDDTPPKFTCSIDDGLSCASSSRRKLRSHLASPAADANRPSTLLTALSRPAPVKWFSRTIRPCGRTTRRISRRATSGSSTTFTTYGA